MGYIDTTAQLITFLLSLCLGALLCLLFDLIRFLHKILLKGFFEVLLSDLLFWTVAAFITFCFLLIRCKGFVRGYVLFGEAVGFFALHFTLSNYFLSLLYKIYSFFRRIFLGFYKLSAKISAPFKKISKKLIFVVKKACKIK